MHSGWLQSQGVVFLCNPPLSLLNRDVLVVFQLGNLGFLRVKNPKPLEFLWQGKKYNNRKLFYPINFYSFVILANHVCRKKQREFGSLHEHPQDIFDF